ncbi:MAG TPA: DinB family protein [Anaerolineales bacterium]|jgi:uncharacterized damage-inducible protein DinB|nr:DinB family protein [Anaerolineales bacterium]
MNVNAFRHFYNYHIAENHNLWELVMQLSKEQFTEPMEYSRGSVRDQVLHLISCDDSWFSGLRGVPIPEDLKSADYPERSGIRAHWDNVEKSMRDYLTNLTDAMLSEKPLGGEDKDLITWQVLLHVVNHGTDHRAQLLRVLNDMGLKTTSQDYIFYVYDHLL